MGSFSPEPTRMLVFVSIGIAGLLHTLAALVARVPDPKHAQRLQSAAKFFMWMLPIAVGLQFIANATGIAAGPAEHRYVTAVPCFMLLLWLAILIRAAHVSVLIFQSRRMIRLCLTLSQIQSQQLQSQYDRNSPRRRMSSAAQ